jgi:hypothetical protein
MAVLLVLLTTLLWPTYFADENRRVDLCVVTRLCVCA